MIHKNSIIPLEHLGAISISGPDTEKFMQGQLSADITTLTPTQAQPAIYATLQGRVLLDCILIAWNNVIYLITDKSNLNACESQLHKFARFSKVEISPCTDFFAIGLGSEVTLSGMISPIGHYALQGEKGIYLIRLEDERQLCFSQITKGELLLSDLKTRYQLQETFDWFYQDILSGLAHIQESTQGLYLPHRLHYHQSGHLNFEKGCYFGQEIIARFHYRGSLKHHLSTLHCDSTSLLQAGDTVITDPDQHVIEIVNAVQLADGRQAVLAIVPDEAKTLHQGRLTRDNNPISWKS